MVLFRIRHEVSPHDEVRIDGKLIREKRAIYLFSFQ
jgi:hypothetical protein